MVESWNNKQKRRGEKKDGREFQNTKENYLSSTGMVDQKALWDSYGLESVYRPFSSISLNPTCFGRCFID